MQPMPSSRLIVDSIPGDGPWNMAVDEVLLEAAVEPAKCSIRTYAWREATVSLGYFQSADKIAQDPFLAGLAAVRRLSGGGAIIHHHEITYSCALAAQHPLARDPSNLYGTVHLAIIDLLAESGIPTRLRGGRAGTKDQLLCFGRGDPNDVILQGHKVVGSAQRRRRGAVLQHGAILLRRSEFAPEHPGLLDLVQFDIPVQDLDLRLGELIAAALVDDWSPGALSPAERSLAEELETRKYNRLTWKM
jgi:lipoate-protein ligase A